MFANIYNIICDYVLQFLLVMFCSNLLRTVKQWGVMELIFHMLKEVSVS